MNCEFCHKPTHIWFDCPTKPAGWRPARLAKKSTAPKGEGIVPRRSAKSTSLPVDTNLEGAHRLGEMPQTVNRGEASSEKPTSSEARFDKKAWQREYMREHRKGIRRRVAK